MKLWMISFLILLFISCTWVVLGGQLSEIEWSKTFGGFDDDRIYSVKQTSDGGCIILGETESYGSEEEGYTWLIKTDSYGNEIWNKTVGGQTNFGTSVTETRDGAYMIIGGSNDREDVWLMKMDPNGNEMWNRTFGRQYEDIGISVQQTSDGGYIITGQTESWGYFTNDVLLIKTDSLGNEIWNKTFGGLDCDGGISVIENKDSDYIILGFTSEYGAGGNDIWLIKTDSSGNEKWNSTFGGSNDEEGHFVQETRDGGYVIKGFTESYRTGEKNVWLIKTDSHGKEVWNKTFSGSCKYSNNYDAGIGAHETDDGGYVVLGQTWSHNSEESGYFWLIKTDSYGNEIWNRSFYGSDEDCVGTIQLTDDGGYVILGGTEYGYDKDADVHLIKCPWSALDGKSPAVEWSKVLGDSNKDEYSNSIQQTTDGGYIILGVTALYGSGERGYFWLIKTDSNGNQIWNKTLNRTLDEIGRIESISIGETLSGGYVISGTKEEKYCNYITLIETDSNGNEVMDTSIASGNIRYYYDNHDYVPFFQTSDGGYIITGCVNNYDLSLIKIDSSGNEIWNKTFGGPYYDDKGYFVRETMDKDYIIGGLTSSYGAGGSDIWLIKTDSFGNEIWNKTFDGIDDDKIIALQETNDGGYIIAGIVDVFDRCDVLLIKIDICGNETWNKTLGNLNNFFDGFFDINDISIRETSDGGYIIACIKMGALDDYSEFLLIQTDSSGNEIWNRAFRGFICTAAQKTDDGYVILGLDVNRYHKSGTYDVWLEKVGSTSFFSSLPLNQLVSSSPIPKVSTNFETLSIKPDETKDVTFTVTNEGTESDIESYFSLSVSPGLRIKGYRSSSDEMKFKHSHVGSHIWNSSNKKIISEHELLDAYKAYASGESNTITVTIEPTGDEGAETCQQWIRYRVAFDTIDEGKDYVRDPTSGSIDQQELPIYEIPVTLEIEGPLQVYRYQNDNNLNAEIWIENPAPYFTYIPELASDGKSNIVIMGAQVTHIDYATTGNYEKVIKIEELYHTVKPIYATYKLITVMLPPDEFTYSKIIEKGFESSEAGADLIEIAAPGTIPVETDIWENILEFSKLTLDVDQTAEYIFTSWFLGWRDPLYDILPNCYGSNLPVIYEGEHRKSGKIASNYMETKNRFNCGYKFTPDTNDDLYWPRGWLNYKDLYDLPKTSRGFVLSPNRALVFKLNIPIRTTPPTGTTPTTTLPTTNTQEDTSTTITEPEERKIVIIIREYQSLETIEADPNRPSEEELIDQLKVYLLYYPKYGNIASALGDEKDIRETLSCIYNGNYECSPYLPEENRRKYKGTTFDYYSFAETFPL